MLFRSPYGNVGAGGRAALAVGAKQAGETVNALTTIKLAQQEQKAESYQNLLDLSGEVRDPYAEYAGANAYAGANYKDDTRFTDALSTGFNFYQGEKTRQQNERLGGSESQKYSFNSSAIQL